MQNNLIKAIIKEPYKKAIVSEISNELKPLQDIVGGYIEVVPFPNVDGVDIIVNEEGKIHKLQGNLFLPEYQDCVVGTCVIASYNDEGDFKSLSDKQIKQVNDYIENFQIEKDYDLYDDFEILNEIMNRKMKELNSEME